ncbi:MAG: late competence development ComFB family protein [Cyanobacteriota bacterium]
MNIYQNAMESLVEQEVDRQLKALPPKVASYINRLELIAYALNQLPALYATSKQGLQHQIRRGRATYGAQVAQAVQRAIAVIRRDPLRSYEPLQSKPSPVMQNALYQLRRVLKNERLSWETLPIAVEEALTTPQSRFVPGAYRTAPRETTTASVSAAPANTPALASDSAPLPSVGASSYAAHRLHVRPQRSLSPFPEASGVFVPSAGSATPPPPMPPRQSARPSVRPANSPAPQPSSHFQSGQPASQPRLPQPRFSKPEQPSENTEAPSGWDSCFFR